MAWCCLGGCQGRGHGPERCQAPLSRGPQAWGRAGLPFPSKKPRHVACQRPFCFLDLRIYLYEKSYQGINILGLCTCFGLSWNVPSRQAPLPLRVRLVNSGPSQGATPFRKLSQTSVLPCSPRAAAFSSGTHSPSSPLVSRDSHLHFSISLSSVPHLAVKPPLPWFPLSPGARDTAELSTGQTDG